MNAIKLARKWRSMAMDRIVIELVDEHGCELHTESLCTIPKEHEWFADWVLSNMGAIEEYIKLKDIKILKDENLP